MSKWNASNIRVLGASEASTLLSKDTEIFGTIKTHGSIRIDGAVIGDVQSDKTVTIGSSGSVDGNITAEDIIISGKVQGSLTARSKITLESAGHLEGDLTASRLSIAEGATFRGLSNMGGNVLPAMRTTESSLTKVTETELDRIAAA